MKAAAAKGSLHWHWQFLGNRPISVFPETDCCIVVWVELLHYFACPVWKRWLLFIWEEMDSDIEKMHLFPGIPPSQEWKSCQTQRKLFKTFCRWPTTCSPHSCFLGEEYIQTESANGHTHFWERSERRKENWLCYILQTWELHITHSNSDLCYCFHAQINPTWRPSTPFFLS